MNMMDENPELRWSFISKVYSILTLQLLLTVAVVSVFVFIPPVANFFNNYVPDYVLGIVVVFAQCSAELYHQKHLLSYFFLLIFNVSFALLLGSFCAFLSVFVSIGKVHVNYDHCVFYYDLWVSCVY
ncbi:protein LIFEGUARD [Trifolium repens]|nr:protein LIFEGUARD [Trifolium repens]